MKMKPLNIYPKFIEVLKKNYILGKKLFGKQKINLLKELLIYYIRQMVMKVKAL